MQPIKISTKGIGFFKGILMWILSTRNWTVTKDWHYNINETDYVIPAGFKFDGASIPKFLRTFFSPVGVLLMGGLVHDYGYKYQTLLLKNKKETIGIKDQKWMDKTFRDVNIYVNGFYTMNYLSYWSLRLGGWFAWNGHRKRNAKIDICSTTVGYPIENYIYQLPDDIRTTILKELLRKINQNKITQYSNFKELLIMSVFSK